MNEIEGKTFEEIYKIIHPSSNDYFVENNREIYQCFYDLLMNIDFYQLNVCIIFDIDGFFPIIANQKAKSVTIIPFINFDLLSTNIQLYSNQYELKKMKLFLNKTHESDYNAGLYNELFEIIEDFDQIPKNDCAILIISQEDTKNFENIKKIIKKTVLYEGILIICSVDNHSQEVVNDIEQNTFLTHTQSFILHPTNSVTLDFTIMSIQKSEISFQVDESNLKNIELNIFKIGKIGQKEKKRKTMRINRNTLLIFSESTKNQQVIQQKQNNALSYIFLPLFKIQAKNKSIKMIKKKSFLNDITTNENENDNLFDFDWKYEILTNDKHFIKYLKHASNNFQKECAKLTSFSDINFDAQLVTLPGYGTISEPLDIPVSIRLTSEGIFIYSSIPFYHIAFADYWDINSYATYFPYIKCNDKLKGNRLQLVFVFTKSSRQLLIEDEIDDSNDLEIEQELGFLFDCELDSDNGQTENPPTTNNDNNIEVDEKTKEIAQKEQQEDKDKNEKTKDKNKKEKTKEKNKNEKNKDKDTNEKNKDPDKNENDQNTGKKALKSETIINKLKQMKSEKQDDFFIKPLGCTTLRLQDSEQFVIAINKAISFAHSTKIKRKTEKLINKLNNQKKLEEVDNERNQDSDS